MKRTILACFLLIVLTAIRAHADEPAAEVTEPVIPERELTFEVSEEEYPMGLFKADPKLLEQRYVATFQLIVSYPPKDYHGRRAKVYRSPHLDRGDMRLRDDPSENLLGVLYEWAFRAASLDPRVFQGLVKRIPEVRLPPEEVVSWLTTDPAFHVRFRRSSVLAKAAVPRRWDLDYEVFAPTPEQAQELVAGLLAFYDWGLSYPLQQECLRGKEAHQADVESVPAKLKEFREALSALERELEGLKDYEDVTGDTLKDLTTEIRRISVEIAGVQARIRACERILAKAAGRQMEQIETLSLTAEIDLVGLQARMKALEDLVGKGRSRVELVKKQHQVLLDLNKAELHSKQSNLAIAHYEAQRQQAMPYPVKGNKVVIRPIKWESKK